MHGVSNRTGTARLLRDAPAASRPPTWSGSTWRNVCSPGRVSAAADTRLHFVCARAERLPFPDGTFDLTLCTCAAHHFKDPQTAFHEIRRLTRSRGVFVLAHLLGVTNDEDSPPPPS